MYDLISSGGTMDKNSKIFVAGARGMVGSAIVRSLTSQDFSHIITKSSQELDLREQQTVRDFFESEKPEYVFLAAAKVGGILANATRPAEFVYDNLAIQNNVIEASYQNSVKKLLFLGSSCIYPKLAPQPIQESSLLSSKLEETNEAYAIAKIAGLKMCEYYRTQYGCDYIAAMPTNLYGPNDNFDLQSSHVLPALLRKFHEAKTSGESEVVVWGTGTPLREFQHVDDLANALIYLMKNYSESTHINVGSEEEISIHDLAHAIQKIVGFEGQIIFDSTKPDGAPRKKMNSSRMHKLGWTPEISLSSGIQSTYQWFLENQDNFKSKQ